MAAIVSVSVSVSVAPLYTHPFSSSLLAPPSSNLAGEGVPSKQSKPQRRNRKSSSSYLTCRASWQELAGVLVFSAIPFTAVKVIANSSLGETLQKRMLEKKKDALINSSKFRALARTARKQRSVRKP